jgi:TolB-like protein/DNA-binding SARP family transcriptional activator
MTTDVEIQLLGPLTVVTAGEARALPKSRKTRALLAMLALEPRQHRRSALCEWIWPDTADPRAALRWSLSKIRDTLGDTRDRALVSTRDDVGLEWSIVRTDVATLERLLDAPETADPVTLIELEQRFERAPLSELDRGASTEFELWLAARRDAMTRLHQRLLAVLIGQLTGDAATGDDLDSALDYARKRVALDPLDKAANADLLALVFRHQGREEARATLERMRQRLTEAGLDDAEVLAAWRRLTTPQPSSDPTIATTAVPRIDGVAARPLPTKPSVAVLPFEDLGGHDGGGVLAEGVAVDLNARLSRLQGLFVIARASARRFSLAEHESPMIGSLLGVRYLVHGTTQRTTDRLRVTVSLIEAERGAQLWSEHFDRPLGDLFEVQDSMANAIVSALEPQIDQAEMDRARLLPTENLNAWECYHRAMWHGFRFTADDNQLAHGLLQRALTLDPQFARAYAALSFNHFSRAFLHSTDDVAADVARAVELAERAVGFDGRDAMSHWSLARARFLNREHDAAMDAIDRALIANPNYAQGHYARGYIATHADRAREAIPNLDMSQRLSPFDPLLFGVLSAHGISLAVQGEHEAAADWAVRATHEPNAHFHIHAVAAGCLELAGNHAAAVARVREALARRPDYTIAMYERSFPFKDPSHHRIMADALARAGLKRR